MEDNLTSAEPQSDPTYFINQSLINPKPFQF